MRVHSRASLALAAVLSVACRRNNPPPPRPSTPDNPAATPAPTDAPAPPSAPANAGPRPVALVRVRNVGAAPITIMTNPDVNEMLHTWRLNIPDDRSDRAALYLNDLAQLTRVKLFPVDLPRCDTDASAGFGGLGQTGSITLAPGEAHDLGAWDGIQREEVVDPVRGVCLREAPAPPGRYRFHFDNPHEQRPECARLLFRLPLESDGGVPVLEIRCQPRPDGAAAPDEE